MKVGIIGLGFVGSAIYKSFSLKEINVIGYDKYKDGGIGNIEECLNCNILFLALPTKYNSKLGKYNISALEETCKYLENNNYNGIIIIKSTVEPEVSEELNNKYKLQIIHNPEFLKAISAFEDFHNQKHVVLGKTSNCLDKNVDIVEKFYRKYYKGIEVSRCTSTESESMKIFVNSFYSVKIQFFTELYLLCKKNGTDFNKIKKMMIKNKAINKKYSTIPGPDGKISYGGLCFPKDTNALNKYMERKSVSNLVLDGTIEERNKIRNDSCNIE